MPYDPSRTPIRELILQDIETQLATIQGAPSYATKFLTVRRWNGNVLMNIPAYPCALIVPLAERSDDTRSCVIEHIMEVGIVLGVRASTWASDINAALAEVRVSLLADPSRDGNAVTTRIVEEEVFDGDPRQSIGSAQMIAEVHYRTLYDDPTTAI